MDMDYFNFYMTGLWIGLFSFTKSLTKIQPVLTLCGYDNR